MTSARAEDALVIDPGCMAVTTCLTVLFVSPDVFDTRFVSTPLASNDPVLVISHVRDMSLVIHRGVLGWVLTEFLRRVHQW